MQRRRQARYGDRQIMQIRKNADGSYILICCTFEARALENALASYAEQTEKINNRQNAKGSEEWFPMQNYAVKLWNLAREIYEELPYETLKEIERCRYCAASLDNGPKECKVNQ